MNNENRWENKLSERVRDFQHTKPLDESKMQAFFDKKDQEDQGEHYEVKNPTSFRWIKVAASIVLLFVAGWGILSLNEVTVDTGAGQLAETTLPDGSLIKLSYESEVSFNKLSWFFSRDVQLIGQSYFEVEKGSKFSVISNHGTTSVLGTKFSVRTLSYTYEVKCFEGRVAVNSGQESRELTQGEGVLIDKEMAPQDLTFTSSEPDWMRDEMTFNNSRLALVFSEMERVFDIEFVGDSEVKNEIYSGFFPTNNLDLALKLVLEPFEITYEKNGRKVEIKEKEK